MFSIYVPLGTTTFGFPIQVTNGSRTPSAADATPTYRIYGPSGGAAITSGTSAATVTDSQTGFYFVTNVAITTGAGFAAGTTYFVRCAYAVSSTSEVDLFSFTVT